MIMKLVHTLIVLKIQLTQQQRKCYNKVSSRDMGQGFGSWERL